MRILGVQGDLQTASPVASGRQLFTIGTRQILMDGQSTYKTVLSTDVVFAPQMWQERKWGKDKQIIKKDYQGISYFLKYMFYGQKKVADYK